MAGRSCCQAVRILESLGAHGYQHHHAQAQPRRRDDPDDQATILREMSKNLGLNRIFISKLTERLLRMIMIEQPKVMNNDQQVLHELRTLEP